MQSKLYLLAMLASLSACGGSSGGSDSNEVGGNGGTTPTSPKSVVLNEDTALTNENSDGVIISIFANDEGITADIQNTLQVSMADYGTVTINDDDTLTYKPNADYYGEDTFTYSVTDEANEKSYESTVTATINPVTTLSTVMTYPSPGTVRSFGGSTKIEVRGKVTNQDGSAALNADVISVKIDGIDTTLTDDSHWKETIALEQMLSSKVTVVTQALDNSESSAEATIKNEALMAEPRRLAYAGNQVVYVVDEYSDTLIKSDLSVEFGHQSIIVDGYLNEDLKHEIRDVAWDENNNRIILAVDIFGTSDTAKVLSVDPESGAIQLLYQDSEHERYSALEWIGNDQFIALSGNESSSTVQLIHVDISDPMSPVRTAFAGQTANITSDFVFHNNVIYMTQRTKNNLLSIGLPEEGELWASYSLVTGAIDSESKGSGPDLSSPRGVVMSGSTAYVADNTGLLQVNTLTGERTILNDDLVFAVGIDIQHDIAVPALQLVVSDSSKMSLYSVNTESPALSIEAINTTASGEQAINDSNGLALAGNDRAFITDENRILSISLANGDREVLPVALPSGAGIDSLVYDAINQWLFAGDSDLDSIYKIDLSNSADITYSVLASGITSRLRDMTLMNIDESRLLIVTQIDALISVDIETGAVENLVVDVPNDSNILEIEAGQSALYLLQHNYDGVLKLTQNDGGCFCNREEFPTGGLRPSSTLALSDDESTAYFVENGVFGVDLSTGDVFGVSELLGNAVSYRGPTSSAYNAVTNALLTTDGTWNGLLETDIESGQTSIVSQ